jgi:hypothetical protein
MPMRPRIVGGASQLLAERADGGFRMNVETSGESRCGDGVSSGPIETEPLATTTSPKSLDANNPNYRRALRSDDRPRGT